LAEIPYVDDPDLKFNDHESTSMPFRYVNDKDGKPIMPEVCRFLTPYLQGVLHACSDILHKGMVELIKKDADKAIDDLF
jgi:ribosome biogenesis SPOUT family RNA methylase Rps3